MLSFDHIAFMSFGHYSPIAVRGQVSHGENKKVLSLAYHITAVQVLEGSYFISLSFWSLGIAK